MSLTAIRLGQIMESIDIRFLSDPYGDCPDNTDPSWEQEYDAYLATLSSAKGREAQQPELSYEEVAKHTGDKSRRISRRNATAKAKERKLLTLEWVLSGREHFAYKEPEWYDRSRHLVGRGRSIRAVLDRTWAQGEDRHDMVCTVWREGHDTCHYRAQLRLGGKWRRHDCNRWHREPVARSTVRNRVIDEAYRDYLADLADAERQPVVPVIIIVAYLLTMMYWPYCRECGVLVAPGAQDEHRYGHVRSHRGYSEWLACKPGAYTTQSFNWDVKSWPLYFPLAQWVRRRDWTTHVRKIVVAEQTMYWQPRPKMNQPPKPLHKSSKPAKPGDNNYTVV